MTQISHPPGPPRSSSGKATPISRTLRVKKNKLADPSVTSPFGSEPHVASSSAGIHYRHSHHSLGGRTGDTSAHQLCESQSQKSSKKQNGNHGNHPLSPVCAPIRAADVGYPSSLKFDGTLTTHSLDRRTLPRLSLNTLMVR